MEMVKNAGTTFADVAGIDQVLMCCSMQSSKVNHS